MISRRLLRIKVLQTLYSEQFSINSALALTEKNLNFSINKSYDLFHLLLQLPVELVRYEQSRIELGKEKMRPSPEELNPNTRFLNNGLINILSKNKALNKYLVENKINWSNNQEIIRDIYQSVKQRDYFINYMTSETNSFNSDKKIVLEILEKEVPDHETLIKTLEDQSIFWNSDLDFILSMAIKTLKSFTEKDSQDKILPPLFKNDEDQDFSKYLLRKVLLNQEEYSNYIRKFSQNWEFERIATMDTLIMQMALAEFLEFPTVPTKVTLNEYIEIAKLFSTPGSCNFINGILDKIITYLKSENLAVKKGRGLIGEGIKK